MAVVSCVTADGVAQGYPARPIRLVSPFPPAGGTDATARLAAQALSEQMGQQVIVDNRGGAGGRIGMDMVAKALPDGYTLVLGQAGPFAVLPASGISLPYDTGRDFQPVSLLATQDYILTVHPSLPVRSIRELLALAKSKPLTYASSGNISGPHLAGELLNMLGEVGILHIPYKGNGPAALALISGEAAIMFGRGSVVPHIATGKLRGIATTGATRSSPDLPTLAETLPGYEMTQWHAILAPARTPADIIGRLNREIAVALANPKVAQGFINLGTQPLASTPQELASLIRADTARYAKLIKAAKINVE